MAKIFVPPSMDMNNDGKVTIDELFRSTMLIYALIVGATSAVVWGMWVLVAGRIPQFLTFGRVEGAIVAFSVPVAAYIGIKRMLRYERMEQREQISWELEHEQARWQFNQARGVAHEAASTGATQAQIDAAAKLIIDYYYTGRDWSREGMEKAGLMTADLWNDANAMLKKRHIRQGRKRELVPETHAEAWGLYCEGTLKANQFRMAGARDDWREAK